MVTQLLTLLPIIFMLLFTFFAMRPSEPVSYAIDSVQLMIHKPSLVVPKKAVEGGKQCEGPNSLSLSCQDGHSLEKWVQMLLCLALKHLFA